MFSITKDFALSFGNQKSNVNAMYTIFIYLSDKNQEDITNKTIIYAL